MLCALILEVLVFVVPLVMSCIAWVKVLVRLILKGFEQALKKGRVLFLVTTLHGSCMPSPHIWRVNTPLLLCSVIQELWIAHSSLVSDTSRVNFWQQLPLAIMHAALRRIFTVLAVDSIMDYYCTTNWEPQFCHKQRDLRLVIIIFMPLSDEEIHSIVLSVIAVLCTLNHFS